ncbi:MAG: molybdenum ABC transporter ATP-binding protein [Motiliproteus sp.]
MSPVESHGTDPLPIELQFRTAFGDFNLDVELQLPARGITALFGHSGSGKTSLLRCIAGLEQVDGRLSVNGQCWQDAGQFLPVHQRPLAYVFQEASLFPHLSVRRNLEYGYRRIDPASRKIEFSQAVEWLGLEPLLERSPDTLSGGERQRVAIGRALLTSPELLLMDEPLSALDLKSKREILPYLEQLHEKLSIPVLYVTHALDEVARLADHLVVLEKGRALASGALTETLARLDLPIRQDEDAGVVINATIAEKDSDWHLARAEFDGGSIWVKDSGLALGKAVRLRVLARDVSLAQQPHHDQSIQNLLPAQVREIVSNDHPAVVLVRAEAGADTAVTATSLLARLTARSAAAMQLAPGSPVWLQIKSVAVLE